MLSLVGLLKHATKVVAPGRTSLSRMYHATAHLKHLSYYTRLTVAFHSDLRWWHLFATHWNDAGFFTDIRPN